MTPLLGAVPLVIQTTPAGRTHGYHPAPVGLPEVRDTPSKIRLADLFPQEFWDRSRRGRVDGETMRADRGRFETYHLMCQVCGALPVTTCIDDDYQELAWVHSSRRMSIAERNWRFRQGW